MRRDVVWSFIPIALGLVAALPLSVAYAADLASDSAPKAASAPVAPSASAKVQPETFEKTRAPQVFDRVKAVPKKQLLKRHRFELTPQASASLNDGFYEHLSFGGSAIYYIHDAFGFGLGADYLYLHAQTSAIAEVRTGLTAAPAAFTFPSLFAHANFYWTPLYGKVSLPGGGIAQFDLYATVGAGVATSFGVHNPPAFNIGLGQHYAINSWAALRVEVRDTIFLDRQVANGVPRSSVQSYVMINAGLSFFIPPTFEYTYP